MAEPGPADLHAIGTIGVILRYATAPDGSHHIICGGDRRFRIVEYLTGFPFLVARVETIEEPEVGGPEIEARMMQLKEQAAEALKLIPDAPEELASTLQSVTAPAVLAYLVTNFLDIKIEEKQQILEINDPQERLDRVLWFLAQRLEVLRLSHDIGKRTRETMEGRQREFLLREQLRTIQKELGEGDDKGEETASLAEAIAKAKMPPDVEKHARKELARLERMSDQSGESSMVRTYLEWLSELPWSVESGKDIDIAKAREVLEADHHGLEKIKRRIIEYLAVRKLNPAGKAPILCFVGPPGVGKTSLGQSIARATGREFARVSLGGVHDEAEIRGHRRTYIGALPGTIIAGAAQGRHARLRDDARRDRQARARHPGRSVVGAAGGARPRAELDLPRQLPRRAVRPQQGAVHRDRQPARHHPRAAARPHGGDPALRLHHQREAGDRAPLSGAAPAAGERAHGRAVRDRRCGAARDHHGLHARGRRAQPGARDRLRVPPCRRPHRGGDGRRIRIDAADIAEILGAARFEAEVAQRTSVPGVATGMAWTPVGGDILFIEATRIPGHGKLILTGQLGDVMKESAQAALSLVKSKHRELGIDPKLFDESDIHVHVPAGAIPKDGPSAGVAMFTALASLVTDRAVRSDLSMTGEISLRGLVLPVGGIKEKVLAAMLAGIKTVMLPARNRRDWDDIPEETRAALQFVWLETVDQALATALAPPRVTTDGA